MNSSSLFAKSATNRVTQHIGKACAKEAEEADNHSHVDWGTRTQKQDCVHHHHHDGSQDQVQVIHNVAQEGTNKSVSSE